MSDSQCYTLTHDGKPVLTGTYFECLHYIHTHHSYSLAWAIKWEGYNMVPVEARGGN